MYIYPDNLKARASLWLWHLKDVGIIGISLVISIFAVAQTRIILPLVVTAVYAFLTIRHDDISILDYIRNAWNFFIGGQQTYYWRAEN